MVKRFIAGLHPGFGTYGVWLSQPGVDVTIPGPLANFILRPDVKFEQVVLTGVAVAPSNGFPTSVALPADLVKQPYIWIQVNNGSGYELPHSFSAQGGSGAQPRETFGSVTLYTDRFEVRSATEQWALYFFYMVFNRSVGL